MSILVTGGAGYIGSHTIIELINQGVKSIISVDNFSNSDVSAYDRIKQITGVTVINYNIDLTDLDACREIFSAEDIKQVVHFAAFKSVPESVENPLLYYHNNLSSLVNLLKCCNEFDCHDFIFSSSCSVYGNIDQLPVTEKTTLGDAESPYAQTKLIGEKIVTDATTANPNLKAVILRYFNPVGAHQSGLNGEPPSDRPNNLVPYITQTAAGLKEQLKIFGGDYDTKDGTCVRDYIHVTDIAEAHILALDYFDNMHLQLDIFNLGTGDGVTVLEVVKSFECANNLKLNYTIVDRRKGDVEAVYADNTKAKDLLGWSPKFNLQQMMKSAWMWQQHLSKSN